MSLYSPTTSVSIQVVLQPCKNLLYVAFLILAIIEVHSNTLLWFLICIFLIINDVDHLFMYLRDICTTSLVDNFFALILVFYLSYKRSLYILEISPLLSIKLENIFSQSVA